MHGATLRAQALVGGLIGLALLAGAIDVHSAIELPLVEVLVVVGALVVAPLAIEAASRSACHFAGRFGPSSALWLLARTQPICVAPLLLAIAQPQGALAGLLCVPWLIQACLVACLGLLRLSVRGGPRPMAELAVDAGCLYLPVGAAWLLASRMGWQPMGFSAEITLLTAAHFHYAGLAAPVIVGQIGRLPGGGGLVYDTGAALVAATPILVAIGITASPLLEVVTAVILAFSVALIALIYVARILPASWRARRSGRDRAALLLLAPAQLVSLGTMTLALLYALSEYQGAPVWAAAADWLTIPAMAKVHGLLNALCFCLPSLACLSMLAPPARDA